MVENLTDALRWFAPKAHTDRTDLTGALCGEKSHGCSPLVYSKGSHRFNEIQQEDCLWKFVVICGRKIFTKNIRVIREIRGSKTSHEFVFFGVRL